MSLKFYTTPSAGRPWRPPMMEEDCRRYRNRARRTDKWIPPQLALEEVIRNNTASPCSLNDFMDFLVYVEQDAEPLQFFLWFCEYIHSWTTELTPEQRALAPRWDPDRGRTLAPGERRAKNLSKVSNILEMLDEESNHRINKAGGSTHKRNVSVVTKLPYPTMAVIKEERDEESREAADSQAAPAPQPFRADIDAITNHYIALDGPRRLNLTKDDRNAVLAATATTTHPSALLLAFEKTEAVLRGKLHPDFIRYCMANANRATTRLLRLLGCLLFILGLALDAVLVLSPVSRYYRLLSTPLLFAGLAILVAALDGVSLSLYLTRRRQIRPWEVPEDLEAGTGAEKHHRRKATPESVAGTVDPLRKPSLQTLGPANVFSGEEWVATYERRWLWQLLFERKSGSQDQNLRLLQHGVVAGAVLWATLTTVGLGVGSVFIPSYDML
ncbi:hypothetical protein CGRA01v4_01193 [Colletotrichum graminicola]|uniref:RGS domain-containing protein n=1 Tax=Colletotrichum graminicola (strain M1.001 / M2 / FGSC 10212) TaxID=645133 RepID=E3QGF5_COLGM|nr:uncharacterized protein GLRG_05087 [Colletotrichum graminicola M1.001]EFQ29943.1 hypothetical protein GLRG_05087 [Colletotrichum graminicola M1.001]WDK09914.1 hypothetical protein CGRA01v4_01193 [Colletotrichum graminicola]